MTIMMTETYKDNDLRIESARDSVREERRETQEAEDASFRHPNTLIDVPRPARVDSQGRILAHRFTKGSGVPVSKTVCIRTTYRPTRPKLRDAAIHPNIGAYIVIGIVDSDTGEMTECLQDLADSGGKPKDLIDSMQAAVRVLRPWYIRWFTLKSVGAFGLYECHAPAGHHTVLELSDTAKLALLELYYDFIAGRKDENEAWKAWVQQHFNAGDTFPGDRRLGLQVILKWSVPKIVTYVSTPVIASLIFGFAYTFSVTGPGVDKVAVLQTAWTVSSYIVTTAGGLSVFRSLESF